MNALTEQLATALASAVAHQADACMRFEEKPPAWFQPAVDALEAYEEQRKQELLDKVRIY